MFIEWGEEYETGYPLIDKGHRGIVDISNRLEWLDEQNNPEAVGQVLCEALRCFTWVAGVPACQRSGR